MTDDNIQNFRANIKQLDEIMNLIGELAINKNNLEHIASMYDLKELTKVLSHCNRLITDLQKCVLEIRMVPIDYVFNKFPIMVRDLSKAEGKEIDFIIDGKDIELDRTVLDRISDPLAHLLRNAVDHGIEPPEERESNGKSRTGTIKLTAKRVQNKVIIEVEDDGRGMNEIITEGTVGEQLGVGLEVVKSCIESLGGSVKIESHTGVGSKFTLQLPLTVAIVQYLLVGVGKETYRLPLNNVLKTLKINYEDIITINNHEVFVLKDQVIPLLRLHDLLGIPIPLRSFNPLDNRITVVIIEKDNKNLGLIVDTLIEKQEIVIKSLGDLLKTGPPYLEIEKFF